MKIEIVVIAFKIPFIYSLYIYTANPQIVYVAKEDAGEFKLE